LFIAYGDYWFLGEYWFHDDTEIHSRNDGSLKRRMYDTTHHNTRIGYTKSRGENRRESVFEAFDG